MKGTEYMDKFVNSILNDCSYCLEGGLDALKKVKKHEIAEERGVKYTDEEKENSEQD